MVLLLSELRAVKFPGHVSQHTDLAGPSQPQSACSPPAKQIHCARKLNSGRRAFETTGILYRSIAIPQQ